MKVRGTSTGGHDLNCRIIAASSRNNNDGEAKGVTLSTKSQARIMKSLRRLGCLHTLIYMPNHSALMLRQLGQNLQKRSLKLLGDLGNGI